MRSGTYWEYICPRCGWFPSFYIGLDPTKEQSDSVKKVAEQKVSEHDKKCIKKSK